MYKDITTHSRGDEERKPRILENEAGGIIFRVHKHIYYGDMWLLSCQSLGIDKLQLGTTDMEEAKKLGIRKMVELIDEKIEKYLDARKILENYLDTDL